MVQKSHGKMHRTRKRIHSTNEKSITKYLNVFKPGEEVIIKYNATTPFPNPAFNGKPGIVEARVGRCYRIKVKNMRSDRHITVRPEHIMKMPSK